MNTQNTQNAQNTQNTQPTSGDATLHTHTASRRDNIFALLLLAASIIFSYMALHVGFAAGFAVAVWLLAAVAMLYLRGRLHFDLLGTVSLVACLAASGSFLWYGMTAMTLWKLLLICMSASLFFVSASGDERGLLADFRAFFAPVVLFFGDSCPNLPMTARAFFGRRRGMRTAGCIVLGLIIAVPTVMLAGRWLVDADAAFDALVGGLRLDFSELMSTVIFGALLFVFLLPLMFAAQRGELRADANGKAPRIAVLEPLTVAVVLGSVSALYLVYLVSQLSYLVGGFAGMLPEDMTFSAYARRGFGEMCALCVLNLALIFFARLFLRDGEERLPGCIRILVVFISGFSLFLIAAALAKMLLYIRTYGLTFLRIATSVFMLFLFFVFIAFIVRCFCEGFKHIRAILLCGLLIATAASVADLEALTVRYNMYAYESGMHKTIDVYYLAHDCGDIAVPALLDLCDDENEYLRQDAVLALQNMSRFDRDGGPAAYSVASARAKRLLNENSHKFSPAKADAAPLD